MLMGMYFILLYTWRMENKRKYKSRRTFVRSSARNPLATGSPEHKKEFRAGCFIAIKSSACVCLRLLSLECKREHPPGRPNNPPYGWVLLGRVAEFRGNHS